MSTNDDHTEVEIGELPGALESLGPIGDNVLLAYFGIYRNCCTPHHKSANIGDSLQKHAEDLRRREAKVVVAGALAGSASDTLEAGIRCATTVITLCYYTEISYFRQWTGCGGMQKDPKKAMDWWASIVGDQALNTPPVPKRYRVRALSCLANAHWEMRSSPGDGPGVWNVDALWHAAFFANECASLGFVSPAVLLIGMQTKELVDQGKLESFRQQRFEGFEFLWEVVDDRIRHVEEKENARDEKVSRSPNAYICAAEGCGIEGTRKSGLMSCAGPCPRDMKPSYCSKECQKTVSNMSVCFA